MSNDQDFNLTASGHRLAFKPILIEGELFVLVIFAWMYFNVMFGLSPFFYHLLTFVIILLAFIKWIKNDIKLNWKLIMILLGSVLIPSIMNRDYKGLLAGWSYFIGFIGYFVLFYDKNISMNVVIKSLIWVIIPGYLLSALFVGEGPRSALQSNPSVLIPLEVNKYRVNIGPAGTTVHFSAEIAFLSFLASLQYLEKNRLYLLPILLSSYLIIFSGARSIYFSGICAILIVIASKFKNEKWMLPFILSLGMAVYGVGLVDGIPMNFEGAIGDLSKMNEYNRDLSSGRSWLWAVHFDQFIKHPIFGVGRQGIDLLFQNWDFEILPATSESFYTAQIAIFGVFGLSFFMMIILVINKAIANKQIIVTIMLAHMLIGTISNSTYGGITSTFIPIMLSIVAASLKGAPFILKQQLNTINNIDI